MKINLIKTGQLLPKIKNNSDKLMTLLKLNYNIFPFLWTLTFFIGILESFTYSGYSFRHLFLPFHLIFAMTLFSGMVSILSPRITSNKKYNQDDDRTIFSINKLLTIPLVVSYVLVNSLEAQNYHNYIFSTIHLQPNLFFWPVFLSVYTFVIGIKTSDGSFLIRKFFLRYDNIRNKIEEVETALPRIVFTVIVLNLLVNSIIQMTPWMTQKASFMIKKPFATYDEKMKYMWGDFYDYMLFVRNNTPENAIIMYPPMMNPWNDVGNGGLIRYFLYPRTVVQDIANMTAEIDESADYVMLAWGSGVCTQEEGSCHGWPRKDILADYVVYKVNDSSSVSYVVEDTEYRYMDKSNEGAWGLIKVKK